ncbi:Gfo/Idh/MocA family protein [Clostridium sp. 'White wine YQ']|uniref:Gfo/Idh/MocA family protein n=1 Tax=Clostridium sp. 'White wine YQ' TaxID=3027474 RepID=UPI002366092F|nr:Gfo/Idh/MocA family oxidoreductase [Clostridium sp. 'White wine YQ']MDD7794610.1 Gfo/Idh/MocA family oxidoreductase [Clostridium sp. 'White wine YQ']
MKFLVIGLGSMGKRRIRILKKNHPQVEIIGVDLSKERCDDVHNNLDLKCYHSLNEAINIEKPNAAIVCTSPITHSSIILECLENNLHVFTEINLVSDNYEVIIEKAKKNNLKLLLSSTFLYRNEIKYIGNQVKNQNEKVSYRYHIGQYLPDWHPWESYKNFFVGDKRTNGCREIFAIELPWIIKTFGKVVNINVYKNNITNLDIGYYDNYSVLLEHENGNIGTLNVDVACRKAVRNLEIYNEELYIEWNGTPESLQSFNNMKKNMEHVDTYSSIKREAGYASNIIENAYESEIEEFIKYITGEVPKTTYSFEEDYDIIKLINKIEGV